MNLSATNKITNTTVQYFSDGTSVALTFQYPANFKIGDTVEVTAPAQDMQLFEPQHQEGCFTFDIEIWDDRIRLQCDSMKQLENDLKDNAVFGFKIREIDLFATAFPALQKAVAYN